MKDATGRDLAVGQIVDLLNLGTLQARVVRIEEAGLIDTGGRRRNSILILQVGIPFELEPGTQAPCYIVREAEPEKDEKKGPRRIN